MSGMKEIKKDFFSSDRRTVIKTIEQEFFHLLILVVEGENTTNHVNRQNLIFIVS